MEVVNEALEGHFDRRHVVRPVILGALCLSKAPWIGRTEDAQALLGAVLSVSTCVCVLGEKRAGRVSAVALSVCLLSGAAWMMLVLGAAFA